MKFDSSSIAKGLDALENKTDIAVRALLDTGAMQIQSKAQNDAKWTDRTGRARQTLNAKNEPMSYGYRIRLAHGVDYGIWLELAHEKRFSIIPSTLTYMGTYVIMPSLQRLFDKISK